MSLKNFSELFVDLDSSNSTNNKIEVLKNYFLSNWKSREYKMKSIKLRFYIGLQIIDIL